MFEIALSKHFVFLSSYNGVAIQIYQAVVIFGWFDTIQLAVEKWLCLLSVSQLALYYWVNCCPKYK